MLSLVACGGRENPPIVEVPRETAGPSAVTGGVTVVDVKLDEYAFIFDPTEVVPGDVVFSLENVGEYPHQFRVVRVFPGPTFKNLLDMGNAERTIITEGYYGGYDYLAVIPVGSSTEGYAFVTLEPGEKLKVSLAEPVVLSGYALVCFARLPNDEIRYSHALRGMLAEFAVQ